MSSTFNIDDTEVIAELPPQNIEAQEQSDTFDISQAPELQPETFLEKLSGAHDQTMGLVKNVLDPAGISEAAIGYPDKPRAAYQIPAGLAKVATFPLDLWQMSGRLHEDEIEDLRRIHMREKGTPLDEESLMKAQEQAQATVPTQENIEGFIEEKTGLPLTPKTRTERLIRMSSNIAAFKPGTVGSKLTGAGTGAAVSQGLVEIGVPEEVADFVAFGVGLAGLPEKVLSKVPKVELPSFKSESPKALEARALAEGRGGGPPPDLPPSSFGPAGELQQALEAQEATSQQALKAKQPKDPVAGIRPEAASRRAEPLAEGRVTQGESDLGIRPTPQTPTPSRANLKERVSDRVNPNEIYNTTEAGRALKNQIMELDNSAYTNVNELYDVSRELNSGVNQIHAELADQIIDLTADIRRIPNPSGVQNQLLRSSEDILNSLIARSEDGTITGYRRISNQTLIDQVQSLRQKVDFDFAHGNPKNIFRPLINDIQESVVRVAQQTGNAEAANALLDANQAYREWTTTYNNDYVNPYRDLSNRDYSKLYKRNTNTDNFNVVRDIIEDTPRGQEIIGATQRDIADKAMKKYTDNPRNIDRTEFNKDLRELESTLNPNQIEGIRDEFSNAQRRFPRDVRQIKAPESISKELKAMEVFTGKDPESILSEMNTRSGIRRIEERMTTPKEKKVFEKVKQQKIRDIFREGKVKADYSGEDIQRVLNKTKNYELIEELTSPEIAKDLLESAEKMANKKFTKENLVKFGKESSNRLIKYKVLKLLLAI